MTAQPKLSCAARPAGSPSAPTLIRLLQSVKSAGGWVGTDGAPVAGVAGALLCDGAGGVLGAVLP